MPRLRSPFQLTLLSKDPAWISAADAAGVERVGVDIERLGKKERQRARPDARISDHTFDDLKTVVTLVRTSVPFVRLNPPHPGTSAEVEEAITVGARSLMLPGFRAAAEVERFICAVRGRAEVILLLETAAGVAELPAILRVAGIDEIMVGLNDLSIEWRLDHAFHVAASDALATIAERVRTAGIPFGFGGVARRDTPGLPVPADLVLARYAALGARSAWVARSFFSNGMAPADCTEAIAELRSRLHYWFAQSPERLADAGAQLRAAAALWRPAGSLTSSSTA